MKAKLRLRNSWIYPFIFAIVTADQLSKYMAPLYFEVVCNQGLAWGFTFSTRFLIVFSAVIISFLIYWAWRQKSTLVLIALSLIAGGGLANLADRIIIGCVRDFISFPIWPSLTWLSPSLTRWPSFNLADSTITAGVILLIYQVLVTPKIVKKGVKT